MWGTFRRIGGIFASLFPYIECFLLSIPFFMLHILSTQITYLQGVNFFLLYVFLYAVLRGRKFAVFAFSLSTVGFCYWQMRTQGVMELLIDPGTYIQITELFVVGVYAGLLRDRYVTLEEEKNEEIRYLTERMEDISNINSSNTRIKNYFEEHVINSQESIGWFYDIISQLDASDSGEVLFVAAKVISKVMETGNVSLYSVSQNHYCRLLISTTPRARSLGKSVYIPNHRVIFDPLEENKVFINLSMDQNLPSMASSLRDPDGNMQIIVLLWDMAYERMTLYHSNMLRVIGALIYNAVIRSRNYMNALAHKRYVDNTQILQKPEFVEMCEIYRKANKEQLADYCVLELSMGATPIEEWSIRLREQLRQLDVIGVLSDEKLGVLLTNTSKQEARFVIERLKGKGIFVDYADADAEC